MTTVVYPALVSQGEGVLTADFPDFPGLSVSASSPGELMAGARDKLGRTLQQIEKTGECWPEPSSLGDTRLEASPDRTPIWVDVIVEDTPMRVTISLGERLLARIDAAAEQRSMSRSGYLASAARSQLDRDIAPPGASSSDAIMEEVVAAGRKLQETFGPNSPVGRTLSNLDAIALDGLRKLSDGVSEVFSKRNRSSSKDSPTPEA